MNTPTKTLLAALIALPFAMGTPSAQTLTVGLGAPVTTIDPHFHNVGPNNALTHHIFDRLVERDERARPQPSLAESWRVVSDTVWEFKLRRDVTWHDGRPFT
ncbi:MAG: ABC transporter substrate-binding protein, partial [bacterium]